MLDYLGIALVVLAGACLQGAGGIGFGMFVAPVLAIWHPELVPGPLLLLGGLLSLLSALREFRAIDFRGLGYALAGRIPASFVGGIAVGLLPVRALAIVFALLILSGVAISLRGWRVSASPRTLFVAGVASGFMGTITSVGAPPMAIVMQDAPSAQLRATIGGFFAVGAAFSVIALGWVGHFGLAEAKAAGIFLLPLLAGFGVSNYFAPHVDRQRMRVLVLGMSAAAATVLLALQLIGKG